MTAWRERFGGWPARTPAFMPYALLVLAVFVAYADVYRNEFVFDDLLLIVQNTFLRSWRTLPALLTTSNLTGAGNSTGYYRPFPSLILFLVYQLFGPQPAAFHALNVLLHAANACFVLLLGRRIGLRRWVAFTGALLWALHPLHTEAVSYASGIADLLYAFFCLLGILILMPDFTRRKIWLVMPVFILALASKEAAVIFPALAMSTFFLVSEARRKPSMYLRFWPLWLLAIVSAALFMTALRGNIVPTGLNPSDPVDVLYSKFYVHNLTNRILTALATLPFYFRLIVWPEGLHMERIFTTVASFRSWRAGAGAAIVLLAMLQILWGRGRRGLMFSWAALWFAIALAPMTGIIVSTDALVFEHWIYLPMVGVTLSLAAIVAAWLERRPHPIRRSVAIFTSIVVVALGVKTFLQNEIWRNPETLYENVFRYGEESGRAHANLAKYYLNNGEADKAAVQYQFALENPILLERSELPLIHTNLAVAYLGVETDKNDSSDADFIRDINRALPFSAHISEAISELNNALALDPDYPSASFILSVIYSYLGDQQKASYYQMRANTAR